MKELTTMTLYVALDVSLEKTAVCVMDAEGAPIVERAVPVMPLRSPSC
jgi:hypothetical protein